MAKVNDLDRIILEDERIRKIIILNEDLIRESERKSGIKHTGQLNQYLANKLSVWEQHKTGKYLSVNLVIKYLKICGYTLNYYIEPLEDSQK